MSPRTRLVRALRIVCGGSVIATRSIHAQHDDDFPLDLGETAVLLALDTADLTRPTRLLRRDDVDAVREVYQVLGAPAVLDDRALQTALRHLAQSGSRKPVEGRLVDLMTCAEALFIKRRGINSRTKGCHIAEGAGTLLGEDPELGVEPDTMRRFMQRAYQLRNAEMHGDGSALSNWTRLDGSKTSNLGAVVEDIERVMRRAIHRELVAP
jgi:hypothetical protein